MIERQRLPGKLPDQPDLGEAGRAQQANEVVAIDRPINHRPRAHTPARIAADRAARIVFLNEKHLEGGEFPLVIPKIEDQQPPAVHLVNLPQVKALPFGEYLLIIADAEDGYPRRGQPGEDLSHRQLQIGFRQERRQGVVATDHGIESL